MIKVSDIDFPSDIHELMDIMAEYSQYTPQDIHNFMNLMDRYCQDKEQFDGIVARRDGEIIACGYLEGIVPGQHAKCHIIVRHRSLKPKETIEVIKEHLHILTQRHNLKELIAVFTPDNKSCKNLIKMLGFQIMDVPEEYIEYDEKWKDYGFGKLTV